MSVEQRDAALEDLLAFIRDERGFDFTGYKRASLGRRLATRMQDAKIATFDDYRQLLAREPAEFGRLFDTILINVTSFFRDPRAWESVRKTIVPRILAARPEGDVIRVWSTGCSTGEEAYTVAMLFADAMGDEPFVSRVKIYATDVDNDALGRGRQAVYDAADLDPVPAGFRERYFEHVGESYVFRSDLRRAVIFGRHDLVQDAPISRIDFLVSRNTLMYFDVATQERILANFHFALRDDGLLFLGKSETLVARSALFTPVDLRCRIFAKAATGNVRNRTAPHPAADPDPPPSAEAALIREAGFETAPLAQIIVDRSAQLVAANLQARLQFGLSQRDVGSLLQDLELSYRPVDLRTPIEQAYAARQTITVHDVEWHTGTDVRYLDVAVHPLVDRAGELLGAAITFADVTRYRRLQEALQASKGEVETAYEELQATVEELETTNEELQSTNEELETMNEELQTTNEELETMNEELQSTNEELETINDELHVRTDELDQVNLLLEAILGSLTAAVVVLDTELRVQAWNHAARDLWGLRSAEVQGRHLLNLDIGLPFDELRTDIRAALAGETPDARVVDTVDRHGKRMRVQLRLTPLGADGAPVHGCLLMLETVTEP